MPFVFVHGVNTRAGDSYNKGVAARHQLLSETTFPQLEFTKGKDLKFFDPYWGGEGASPRWENRSMPRYDVDYTAMGPVEETLVDVGAIPVEFSKGEKAAVLKIARKNGLTAAIDILVLQSLREGISDSELAEIAKAASAALEYAEKNEFPDWLKDVSDDDKFIFELSQRIEKAPEVEAAMGLENIWEDLKETAGRIGSSVGDKTSELIIRAVREKIQEQATFFLGDAFVYFTNRWTKINGQQESVIKRDEQIPGKIPSIVLNDLFAADKAKTVNDPYLIVMAHSMGGNIMYDLCSDFLIDSNGKPILEIDLLITVGSQFAMFQEIDMFKGVKLPNVIDKDTRISKPKAIKRWINCFDKNDIFGYNASEVFGDVSDFEYDTGFGVGGAHGGYFERFSFYKRLGKRMSKLLPGTPAGAGAKQ